MIHQKRWKLHAQSDEVCDRLARELSVSRVVAQILLNRRVSSLTQAHEFLSEAPQESQFDLNLLESIYQEICRCIEQKKPVFLYGDYDVDGMTSTSMMVKCLTSMGAVVRYKLPHRFNDGYGLNNGVVDLINQEGCGLFITLDCGITNVAEIAAIKEKTSSRVIVIDHHQIPELVPPADIILNPKSQGTPEGIRNLCTAGIVYKLVVYIATKRADINCKEYLFLAAIGTIADVVPLQDENRRIVKLGLGLLRQVKLPGIKALLDVSKWNAPNLTVRDVGFVIAPRLNAAGRLSSAEYGVKLLLEQDSRKALEIANYLESMNLKRRKLDQQVVSESFEIIDESAHYDKQSVLVLGKHMWHAGVIGIAASKVVEKYNKPVVIVGIDDDIARGSARSIGDVNIYSLLKECEDCFLSFGGHKQAAGFSLKPDKFGQFKEKLEIVVNKTITQEQLMDSLMIDMKLDSRDITFEMLDDVSSIGPFGFGNTEPIFYSDSFTVIDSRLVGNGKHLKLKLQDVEHNLYFDAIGFNLGDKMSCLYNKSNHFAFSLEKNVWNNRETLQLNIKDIK